MSCPGCERPYISCACKADITRSQLDGIKRIAMGMLPQRIDLGMLEIPAHAIRNITSSDLIMVIGTLRSKFDIEDLWMHSICDRRLACDGVCDGYQQILGIPYKVSDVFGMRARLFFEIRQKDLPGS